MLRTLLEATRPRQWLKNLLVLVAPIAAGRFASVDVVARVIGAFIAFCLVSAGVYLINDVLDIESDRLHPVKRLRPLAAGRLSIPVALTAAAVLVLAGSLVSAAINWRLLLVVALYLVSCLTYSLGVKREPVFDLALVSAGFLLRAIAGGVAAAVPLSEWFLLVASFGSLFMVAGKRYAEVVSAPPSAADDWRVVTYSASYLRFVCGLAASATVLGYVLWTIQVVAPRGAPLMGQLSIVPFLLALLRYAVDIDRGAAGAPEDVVLGDRWLLALGLVWFLLFVAATHAG